MELSLITENHLEKSGKELVGIRVQTKTDQVKTSLQPILDTSCSASVCTCTLWGQSCPMGVKGGPQCHCFSPLGHSELIQITMGTFMGLLQQVGSR